MFEPPTVIEHISGSTSARAIFFITFLLTAIICGATRLSPVFFIAMTTCQNILKLAASTSRSKIALRAAGTPIRPGRPLRRNYINKS